MEQHNELEELLNKIKFLKGKTIEQVALDIGYTRPHLNAMKKKPIKKSGEKIIQLIKSKYANILNEWPRETEMIKEMNERMSKQESLISALIKQIETLEKRLNERNNNY